MRKGYTVTKTYISSGDYRLKILILRPAASSLPKEKAPGILWIHGGGYITGMTEMIYMSRAIDLVKKYGAVVITPEYRLARHSPYPAALTDCYTALEYLYHHAEELGVNPDLLMVGGESAGGGLTVALSMAVRDYSNIKIAYQMPLYPMIDDRDTDSSKRNYRLPWNTFFNHYAWKRYHKNVISPPSAYAAPARQTDYSNLPPCYTFVGRKEPFYSETLTYIENLKSAGVDAHVDVYNTGFHGFDMLTPFRKISKAAINAFEQRFLNFIRSYKN